MRLICRTLVIACQQDTFPVVSHKHEECAAMSAMSPLCSNGLYAQSMLGKIIKCDGWIASTVPASKLSYKSRISQKARQGQRMVGNVDNHPCMPGRCAKDVILSLGF